MLLLLWPGHATILLRHLLRVRILGAHRATVGIAVAIGSVAVTVVAACTSPVVVEALLLRHALHAVAPLLLGHELGVAAHLLRSTMKEDGSSMKEGGEGLSINL